MSERDHRVLGPALDLFSFSAYSPGIAFWHPKGMVVYNQLVALMREEWERRGYQEVRAPLVLSADLWHKSGHYDMFRQNMFFVNSEGQEFALKPMNCPGHCVMYAERVRSYREFPLRYAEVSPLHRNENSGALNGLKRVRSFSQDDAHIFCRYDQVEEEVVAAIDFLKDIYAFLGFKFSAELSLRPPQSVGSDEVWEKAEADLRKALKRAGIDAVDRPGEGAFYGPKIDFQVGPDALGRSWQCGTVQLDFQLPKRFGLQYRGEDNGFHEPVMVHRAVFGSFERFIGMLIEHYDGAFPLWLAPEQVRILPVSDAAAHYAGLLAADLRLVARCRVSVDNSPERMSKKLRDAVIAKIPLVVVVGAKEIDANSVSIRFRSGNQKVMDKAGFVSEVSHWVRDRADPNQPSSIIRS